MASTHPYVTFFPYALQDLQSGLEVVVAFAFKHCR